MRLIFLGTPAFAVPTLERMIEDGHEVPAVITQPDRPKGRSQELAASPVKQAAQRRGLAVYQPERIRRPEALELLSGFHADGMVVVGYGQIIPQAVIDLTPHGIVNVHASLLPKYRGAAPVQWAIARGETRTGVTTMQIDAGLDTGDILLQAETAIGPEETSVELAERLSRIGADLLSETMAGLARGDIERRKQDSSGATLAPILKKEDGLIDWKKSAAEIHNAVRGFLPWPGAYTHFRGQRLHVWQARVAPETARQAAARPGQTMCAAHSLFAACGAGALELLEVQLEGKKKIAAADFLNGRRLADNEVFGEMTS
jgi:methionyl-tRNA formyltransferase